MKIKVLFAGALLVLSTFSSLADDPKAKPPEMDAATMEAMMKAMMPGEPHKKLEPMIGTFETKISMWMAPGTDPMTSGGTSENKWVMGGRYVEQRFTGTFNGMPFEGLGYTGYDNVKRQYWGTWMDNMSTGVMVSTGSTEDGKTWSFTSSMPDPMTGKETKVDEKIVVTDADHHSMEMWMEGPDGKMFKSMDMRYARKK